MTTNYTNQKVTYKDLFRVNIKYLEYLLEKSYLSHQYFNNIKMSGDQIEHEFRKILSGILPNRYKVTHGYIVSATSRKIEPTVSPQIDIIIVDTLVPHSIYVLEDKGMEVVPIESVVGIFEIKRTVNAKVLGEALDHLYSIQQVLGINKKDSTTYFPAGVPGLGIMYANPLMGILSLTHEKLASEKDYIEKYVKIIDGRIKDGDMPDLDIWASLCSGLIMATQKEDDPTMLWAYTLREENKKYKYLFKLNLTNELSDAYFLSISLGYILYYLANITGKLPNLENYFFNESL